jgi:anti-sigma factor RsiW
MRRHIDDDELLLFIDGELTLARRSLVATHLETCRTCRDRAELVRVTMAEIAAVLKQGLPAEPESHSRSRVRLASALQRAASSEPTWLDAAAAQFSGALLLRRLGVAAGVGVICAAAFMAARIGQEPRGENLVALGALPEATLTPGAVSTLTAADLCRGVRPSRAVTESVRRRVLRSYRMEHVAEDAYELDALITPELGGSTDPANLWPQRYRAPRWNAHIKDQLEELLPKMVCAGHITLAQAQRDIASDWVDAYKRYFNTDAPRQAHLALPPDEEPELLIVPDRAPMRMAAIGFVVP